MNGYSTTVTAGAMGQTLAIDKRSVGDAIRSLTIGNQTSTTTAVVYVGSFGMGTPLFAVAPGNFQTLPIMASDSVSVVFVRQKGYEYDGAVFVHADPEALAASGFPASKTATLWVWDQSAWDGGDTWSAATS